MTKWKLLPRFWTVMIQWTSCTRHEKPSQGKVIDRYFMRKTLWKQHVGVSSITALMLEGLYWIADLNCLRPLPIRNGVQVWIWKHLKVHFWGSLTQITALKWHFPYTSNSSKNWPKMFQICCHLTLNNNTKPMSSVFTDTAKNNEGQCSIWRDWLTCAVWWNQENCLSKMWLITV